jgi:hypothetical protein
MAELRQEIETMRIRLTEAHRYATKASQALLEVARTSLLVSDSFDSDEFLRSEARRRFEGNAGRDLMDTPYWKKLPSGIVSMFEETDQDPRSFQSEWNEIWHPSDPVGS